MQKNIPKLLSKTRLMRGYQCLKSIYLTNHNKELEPPVTPDLQAVFDQGNAVGEEARKRYPNGVLVENPAWDFFGALKKTRELLQNETEVIFEAAFEYKGCFARADIITYSKESKRWSIFEVKSTTKVKDEHFDDVGLQVWIMANAGLPIEKICIMHINNECRYPNLVNLFTIADVTDELRKRHPDIPTKLNSIFKTIRSESAPDIDIGPHCSEPNDCPFSGHCWSEKMIPDYSIFNLPNIKTKKWDLYSEGIVHLDDPRLSNLSYLTQVQERAINVYVTKNRFIDKLAIKSAMASWKFPLVFLDFETINPAIPRYDNTAPYQQVPFQFSAHIWNSPDAELIHKEYLHTNASDPRPDLIPLLIDACKGNGSIVAYFSTFEKQRIEELSEFSKAHCLELQNLLSRFVAPLPIFREHIYDNGFEGSFSLKAVAPTILGESQSYDGMLVDNGTSAQRAFEEIINQNTDPARRQQLINASLEYCRKDTMVMVQLVKWLYKASEEI